MLVICEYAIAYAIAYFAKSHILHISSHIMAFSKLHMQKLCHISKNLHICCIVPHMWSHFLAFFLPNVVSRPLNIFGG